MVAGVARAGTVAGVGRQGAKKYIETLATLRLCVRQFFQLFFSLLICYEFAMR
jgi:hypothetical protein